MISILTPIRVLFLTTSPLLFLSPILGVNFGYDVDDGPNHWPEVYKSCGGKYQSPINIDHKMVTVQNFNGLRMHGFEQLPWKIHMKNNGHSVELRMSTDFPIQISGGPLHGNNYTLEQLHFHWGRNDSLGSETWINNHAYPMEVHLVFFKTEYGSFQNALKSGPDALTVLALFFEMATYNNRAYAGLIEYLNKVNMPDKQADLSCALPLQYFLPSNVENYYTYHGSLTTPPCLEIVTWIEFSTPIPISHVQLEGFRKLRSQHGPLKENFRPLQELHGRPIFYNERNLENTSPMLQATFLLNILLLIVQLL